MPISFLENLNFKVKFYILKRNESTHDNEQAISCDYLRKKKRMPSVLWNVWVVKSVRNW